MGGSIFLRQGDGSLVEMKETPYEAEAVLQRLLADYPTLLAGEQMDTESPRRWLLVSREMGVPDEENGADRWSLDHLFLDQDGVPTLVETKRSVNRELRRKVVGQILDYAANGVAYWPLERIRQSLSESHGGQSADDIVEDFLQDEERTPEEFWELVRTNLIAGKIRMVFVADVIPPELLRIVQFLSRQLNPAQVFALEVRQYGGEGQTTLVPRVVGKTEKATSPESHVADAGSLMDQGQARNTASLLIELRNLGQFLGEQPRRTFGGSFRYWGYGRMLCGVNVAARWGAPNGSIDVWMSHGSWAEATGVPETEMVDQLRSTFEFVNQYEKSHQTIFRIKSADEAKHFVELLKGWFQPSLDPEEVAAIRAELLSKFRAQHHQNWEQLKVAYSDRCHWRVLEAALHQMKAEGLYEEPSPGWYTYTGPEAEAPARGMGQRSQA